MTHRIRKRKLVNSSLQFKLIATFLLVACVASLFQVLLLNRSLLSMARAMDSNGEQVLGQLPTLLFQNLITTMAVLVPLMTVVGLLVTHRVAGPLYRFGKHLDAIAQGENPGTCSIRKGDELQDLCDSINRAFEARAGATAPSQDVNAEASAPAEAKRAA